MPEQTKEQTNGKKTDEEFLDQMETALDDLDKKISERKHVYVIALNHEWGKGIKGLPVGIFTTKEYDHRLSLKEMQEIVGGYITFAYRDDGLTVCCNDNGMSECDQNMNRIPVGEGMFWGTCILGITEYTPDDTYFNGFNDVEQAQMFMRRKAIKNELGVFETGLFTKCDEEELADHFYQN